jgi:hypothetical protein
MYFIDWTSESYHVLEYDTHSPTGPGYVSIEGTSNPAGGTFALDPTVGHSIPRGQWTLFEFLVYYNTGSNFDGEIHIWVNGTKVMQRTNVAWAGQGSRHWEEIFLTPTYGGGNNPYGPVPAHQYSYFDRLYISGRNLS